MERDPRVWIAALRNSHDRLDPEHTPEEVTADAADLERLRKMFPGF